MELDFSLVVLPGRKSEEEKGMGEKGYGRE